MKRGKEAKKQRGEQVLQDTRKKRHEDAKIPLEGSEVKRRESREVNRSYSMQGRIVTRIQRFTS